MKQNLSIPHPQDRGEAGYQIFWIIRQYLYWPKILQIIFCYCLYVWAAQLITGVFHLDTSLSCWYRGNQVPFHFLWSLFSFLQQGLWRIWPQWIRSLHGWRSWCGRRQKVRTNHNSMKRHSCMPFWRTSRLETILLQIKELLLYLHG
jgi:hypothetical protein